MGLVLSEDKQHLRWETPESEEAAKHNLHALITFWRGSDSGDTLVIVARAWSLHGYMTETPHVWSINDQPGTTGVVKATLNHWSAGYNSCALYQRTPPTYWEAGFPLGEGTELFVKKALGRTYFRLGKIKSFKLLPDENGDT